MTAPPEQQRGHALAATEHSEGGETTLWVNSRCYYANRPIPDFAGNLGPGPSMGLSLTERKVCKPLTR
jgi:hypothetical protein